MRSLLKNKLLVGSFLIFASLNVVVYLWMNVFHGLVPFARDEYIYNANHYIADPRVHGGQFSFLNALGQYDSQWYLKIADRGYPQNPKPHPHENAKTMDGLMYIFFPLLPLLYAALNVFIKNIEVSAFIVTNLLLVANFFSLYYVISRWFSEWIAVKAIFLLTLFPFSIFLRGYYTEGLRLLLFVWLCYFINKKNFLLSALLIGLLCVVSGINLFLVPFLFLLLWVYHTDHKLPFNKMLGYMTITILPLLLWVLFNYLQTGNPFYFLSAFGAWERPVFPLYHNIGLIITFPWLPLRSFYGSQLDVLCIILTILAAFMSRKVIPPLVWFITVILSFTSLFVQDSAGYARFTIVFFPYFVYLAYVLKKHYYFLTLLFFAVFLLIASLGYINWYWVE